jgi:hypothetical protein
MAPHLLNLSLSLLLALGGLLTIERFRLGTPD